MKKIILKLLFIYKRYITPLLKNNFGNACRFTPSCSEYAVQAIEKYGVLKGAFLASKRIFKCHPLSKPGFDPLY